MKVIETSIPDVKIIEPQVFGDERGFFCESFNRKRFREATGLDVDFVQDNHSKSTLGVLRGLHYQIEQPQGKLVRVSSGKVFDVAVDIRMSSPSFGHWVGEVLSVDNFRQMGSHRVSRTVSWCSLMIPSFSTRRPTTTHRITNALSSGTMLLSQLTGQSRASSSAFRKRTGSVHRLPMPNFLPRCPVQS